MSETTEMTDAEFSAWLSRMVKVFPDSEILRHYLRQDRRKAKQADESPKESDAALLAELGL